MDLLNLQPHSVTRGVLGKHFLIYGPPSTRKTTVAAGFPRPLLLATEIGYSFIPGVKAINIDSWYTFKQAVEQLKSAEVRAEFDTIVIDTVSLLAEQCVTHVTRTLGVKTLSDAEWGRGWLDYRKELGQTFNLLAQKGYGLVFIAHSKEERDKEGNIIAAQPGIDGTTAKIINALVDFTFFLNKEEGDDGSSVFAYSNLSSSITTKSRIRGLQPRIEFTFDNVENALIEAIAKMNLSTTDEVIRDVVAKPTLDELKESILDSAGKAKELELLGAAEEIMASALKGVTLGNATEVHYESVLAVDQAIKDLIKGD